MDRSCAGGWCHVVAAVAFALAAMVGLMFAVAGPVALVRLFGWGALVFGALGGALQVYSLRAFHPDTYRSFASRVRDAMPAPATALTRTDAVQA